MRALRIPQGQVNLVQAGGQVLWRKPSAVALFSKLVFSGDAYFDTGQSIDQDTEVMIHASNISWNNRSMFGARQASRYRSLCVHLNTNRCLIDAAGTRIIPDDLNWYEQEMRLGAGQIAYLGAEDNVVETSYAKGTWACPYTIVIGGVNTSGTVSLYATFALHRFQVYQNGALAADYLPASDVKGRFGLYDQVQGQIIYPVIGSVICQ